MQLLEKAAYMTLISSFVNQNAMQLISGSRIADKIPRELEIDEFCQKL